MNSAAKIFSVAFGLFTTMTAAAETFTYEALVDFTDINAGEVPYYRHNGVNALAINAAVEEYRDKFAQATRVFDQATGVYDITITSLGETDGDGTFRFLVDGIVVGSSVNEPATEDYGNQFHLFEDIAITEGALIGVESIAVSNGLIPEGDAYAYARGRWTTLTIETSDDNTPDPALTADLAIDISTDTAEVSVGDSISYTVIVKNLSETVIATNPTINVTFPAQFSSLSAENCNATAIPSVLSCGLAELQLGEQSEFTISAIADAAGDFDITAEVESDQPDPIASNNIAAISAIVIDSDVEPVVDPIDETEDESPTNSVDLVLALEADKPQVEVGDSISYTLTLTNQSETTTATAPVLGVLLPDSLQFDSSDTCTATGQTVLCETEELATGAVATVLFTAIATSVNSHSQLFASASSSQSDDNTANNEAQLVSNVKAAQSSTVAQTTATIPATTPAATTDSQPTAEGISQSTKSGGGGALPLSSLVLLLLLVGRRIRVSTKRQVA